MNFLAHLWLAERSDTSAAGQILGDVVKGRLHGARFDAFILRGIRLHRLIDSVSDGHPAHREMRRRFAPPLRRYAGIVVDIGFDHTLARHWGEYSHEPLADFAHRMAARLVAEWPAAAPIAAPKVEGFARLLAGYTEPSGVQQALTAVSCRATWPNPLSQALPAVLAERRGFAAGLPALMQALEHEVVAQDPLNQAGP